MLEPIITCEAQSVTLSDLGVIRHSASALLLATDGSAPAVRATQHAVLLAKLLGAKLEVVCVYTGLEEPEMLPEEPSLEDCPETAAACVWGLAVARDLSRVNGVDCHAQVRVGSVAWNILQAATDVDADLIVMGDTGRTGLARVALGSTAAKIVKASPVPVLVVKAA